MHARAVTGCHTLPTPHSVITGQLVSGPPLSGIYTGDPRGPDQFKTHLPYLILEGKILTIPGIKTSLCSVMLTSKELTMIHCAL